LSPHALAVVPPDAADGTAAGDVTPLPTENGTTVEDGREAASDRA